MTTISPALLSSYHATHYRVVDADKTITLRIGACCPELQKLHQRYEVTCSAFLTAWNPFSGSTSAQDNDRAQQALQHDLALLDIRCLPGIGIDPTSSHPGEESILALGIVLDDAVRLGKKYRQNAIVWIGPETIPDLILLT